ncbi:hypothetical protein [Stutzerimonas tarimensis]|uniref:Outer membrane protein beta-barrel domain-containing protein n=1 Tax=Stutzerimonas tarimensis TaxID=1507735 RepID=A0ABV7T819_9GAMM
MNKLFKSSLLLAALCPAVALAVPVAGQQEITLSGSGSSDHDFNDTTMALQGSWGTYMDDANMWGVRQTINARDQSGESVKFDGSTRFFYSYHFGTGNTRPVVGVSLGAIYGEGVRNTMAAGPELGVKHWVMDNVFIQGLVEYQFLFRSGSDARDRYDDGMFFYSVGLGYNF